MTSEVHVLFPDGSRVRGHSATHVLHQLMGGWNTDKSIYHLRKQLAERHNLTDDPEQSDDAFLTMLDKVGAWAVGYGPVDFHD